MASWISIRAGRCVPTPGEVRCDWTHQGNGDSASVVVYNRANQTLNLVLEIAGGGVVFASNNEPYVIVNDLAEMIAL